MDLGASSILNHLSLNFLLIKIIGRLYILFNNISFDWYLYIEQIDLLKINLSNYNKIIIVSEIISIK